MCADKRCKRPCFLNSRCGRELNEGRAAVRPIMSLELSRRQAPLRRAGSVFLFLGYFQMAAEVPLLNLFVAWKSFKVGIEEATAVVNAAKRFEKAVKKEGDEARNLLMEVHYDSLVKLKFGFKELAKTDVFFIGAHDRVFKNTLGMLDTQQSITKLFEEFIKGITYFKQQLDPRHPYPIYHRLHSCGPNMHNLDSDYALRAANLICIGQLPWSEKMRRKGLIERCYLERLVYDALYKHFVLQHAERGNAENEQDERHLEHLELVKKDFDTCFRAIDVSVDVRYESGYPTRLEVKRFKKKVLMSTEIFVKTLGDLKNKFCVYEPGVVCHKVVHKTGASYVKVNVFDMEQDWKRGHIDLPLVVDGAFDA